MKIILFSDTHFGIKNNSLKWLDAQLSGMHEMMNYIKNLNDIMIVHCGDLFDSRTSINTYVAHRVRVWLEEMDNMLNNRGKMYIIGGNHDYYTTTESKYNYTSLDILSDKYKNIEIISQQYKIVGGIAMIPWFSFHNEDTRNEILSYNPNYIFTHTDPVYNDFIHNINLPIYTGHIHQPDRHGNKYVIGSCFPIDYADANSDRGFWMMDATREGNQIIINGDPEMIPLKKTIHYYIINTDDLDNIQNRNIQDNDYVEVRIKPELIDNYIDTIEKLKQKCNLNILYLSDTPDIAVESIEVTDIDRICRQFIPDNLIEKFESLIQ